MTNSPIGHGQTASEGWRLGARLGQGFDLSNSTQKYFGLGEGGSYKLCAGQKNTGDGCASQMDKLFRECLFNLGIMSTSSWSKFIRIIQFISMAFLAYITLRISDVLRSTTSCSLHPGHVFQYIHKVSNCLDIAFKNYCFLDLSYTLRGVFLAVHRSCPF